MESNKPQEPIQEAPNPTSGERDPQKDEGGFPPDNRPDFYLYHLLQQYSTGQREQERREQSRDTVDRQRLKVEKIAAWIGFAGILGLLFNLCETRRSVNVAIKNARLDQRAWVLPNDVITPTEYKEGVPLRFGVRLLNTGKTPALNVKTLVGGITWPRGQPFRIEYEDAPWASPGRSIGTLLPSTPAVATAEPTPITKRQLEALQNKVTVLYLYGEVSYDDVFNVSHCTSFCFMISPNESAKVCEVYNQITDTKCEHIE